MAAHAAKSWGSPCHRHGSEDLRNSALSFQTSQLERYVFKKKRLQKPDKINHIQYCYSKIFQDIHVNLIHHPQSFWSGQVDQCLQHLHGRIGALESSAAPRISVEPTQLWAIQDLSQQQFKVKCHYCMKPWFHWTGSYFQSICRSDLRLGLTRLTTLIFLATRILWKVKFKTGIRGIFWELELWWTKNRRCGRWWFYYMLFYS